MHAITGAWAAMPSLPWDTDGGASFSDIGARCDALLAAVAEGIPGADDVGLALLAGQLAEMRAELRDLAASELAVAAIYGAGLRDGTASRGTRRHLRLAAWNSV